MADPRFFTSAGPFSLADLAAQCEAQPPERVKHIIDVAPLGTATDRDIGFLENKMYKDQARVTQAGACFVKAEDADLLPDTCIAMICAYPYRSYALAATLFYPNEKRPLPFGVGPTKIDKTAQIHPSAVIGANVKIGKNTIVEANTTIAQGCEIGENCHIFANVTISHSLIGNRVRIFPGARIGQPGFGYAINPTGDHLYVPQLGRVIIEDGVEIGSNATIDRGAGPDTSIGAGTKIDNLVHIAHNVKIGRGCFLAGQVGFAGSVTMGNGVFVGGQAGFAGHISICDGAQVAAQSGILQDITEAKPVMGTPAVPLKEFMRREAWLRRLIRDRKEP
jgi:UDP-3-O-[3-hydroxymyristoyl] glucosamine N-acyltransferase